jgi:membrane protein implicated in regulation of membrane protease activity
MFILGPLLFGIATFRARVLSRWAGGLLAFGALLIPVGGLVPAEYQPEVALIPVGLALTWLGYALFSERRERTSESLLNQRSGTPEASKAA